MVLEAKRESGLLGKQPFLLSHPSLLNAREAGQQTQEHRTGWHLMRPQNGSRAVTESFLSKSVEVH